VDSNSSYFATIIPEGSSATDYVTDLTDVMGVTEGKEKALVI